MIDADLPDELGNLERQVTTRRRESMSSGLRQRVLDGVASERRSRERESFWHFVVGLAAAFFLCANLSMVATHRVNAEYDCATEGNIAEAAKQIHRLAPEMSVEEAYGQVML